MKISIGFIILALPLVASSQDTVVDKAEHREDAVVHVGNKGTVIITPGQDHADAPPPGLQQQLVFPDPPKKLERDKTTIIREKKD